MGQWSLPETLPIPFVAGYRFSLQIGGMLLTACMGGPRAGFYAQVIYLLLGLSGSQVFSRGGGWGYLQQPTFGYLLGFLPGAWICGDLAVRPQEDPEKSKRIAFLSLCLANLSGLAAVHITGLTYLLVRYSWSKDFLELSKFYSGYHLFGQLLLLPLVGLIAFILRRILMY